MTETAEGFNLTPPDPERAACRPTAVPVATIEELRHLRTEANSAATQFREAIKLQADKYKVKPAALRRYVIALARDLVDEARAEAEDLERLIGA